MKPPDGRAASLIVPIVVLMIAMACFQVGATLAKGLFPLVGATGTTALRTGLAAIMLCVVWRPWRMRLARHEARGGDHLRPGARLHESLVLRRAQDHPARAGRGDRIHRAIGRGRVRFPSPDRLCLDCAGRARPARLAAAISITASPWRLQGVALALLAGVCWALYIIYGRRAGISHGGPSTALGMLVSSLFIVPLGLAQNGTALLAPRILLAGCVVALVSSALPYSLEMIAMPKIPTRTLGVLMSLDPVLGAVAGFALLHEHLSWLQWSAIACIMVASAGSASAHRVDTLPD